MTVGYLPRTEPEKVLQRKVVTLAKLLGWKAFHTFDSRRSERGFPDLVMVRGNHLIFAELKSETGQLTPEQREWNTALIRLSFDLHDLIGVYVWRPSDWPAIERVLGAAA